MKLKFATIALALSSVVAAPSAFAGVYDIDLINLTSDGSFTGTFGASQNVLGMFEDTFNFTFASSEALSGLITSLTASASVNKSKGIELTSLSYADGGFFGSHTSKKSASLFSLTFDDTPFTGKLSLLATGNVIGAGGSYAGSITATPTFAGPPVSPVPEPETYAMMLAGLGLLGFAARRKAKAQA